MKELSIEEKAKAYDKAIEVAKRKLCFDNAGMIDNFTPDDIREIFPELKESEDEDEKIRKALIDYFRWNTDSQLLNEFTNRKIFDWLEKQGKKTIWHNEDEEPQRGSLILLIMQSGTPIVAKIIEPNHTFNHGERWAYIDDLLEKQGEKPQGKSALEAIKEEKVDNANKVEPKDYYSIDPHFGKPVDKVEPKFHEGEWIVHHGTENIYQVVAVIDNQYQLKYGDNYTIQYCADVDRCARLWDITRDAKDGDVLYLQKDGKEHIIIYKGVIKERFRTFVSAYCAYNGIVDAFCFADVNRYADIAYRGIMPATKEQRTILFQKMKEAGYEWDTEKKELKEIKNEIEIPFGAKDSELQEATYYIPQGFHAEIDDDKVVIKKGEKSTAWSEEDEKMIRALVSMCDVWATSNQFYPKENKEMEALKNWLKSLKGRVQPQPKQEENKGNLGGISSNWSEEDNKNLEKTIWYVEKGGKLIFAKTDELVSWLKSLKDRYTWKPSEEQIKALKDACDEHWEPDGLDPLYTLYQELKKLK